MYQHSFGYRWTHRQQIPACPLIGAPRRALDSFRFAHPFEASKIMEIFEGGLVFVQLPDVAGQYGLVDGLAVFRVGVLRGAGGPQIRCRLVLEEIEGHAVGIQQRRPFGIHAAAVRRAEQMLVVEDVGISLGDRRGTHGLLAQHFAIVCGRAFRSDTIGRSIFLLA